MWRGVATMPYRLCGRGGAWLSSGPGVIVSGAAEATMAWILCEANTRTTATCTIPLRFWWARWTGCVSSRPRRVNLCKKYQVRSRPLSRRALDLIPAAQTRLWQYFNQGLPGRLQRSTKPFSSLTESRPGQMSIFAVFGPTCPRRSIPASRRQEHALTCIGSGDY